MSKFKALAYRHEVVVVSSNGMVTTRVRATSQIAVWSNKRQNGPTVRADGRSYRFPNARVASKSLSI